MATSTGVSWRALVRMPAAGHRVEKILEPWLPFGQGERILGQRSVELSRDLLGHGRADELESGGEDGARGEHLEHAFPRLDATAWIGADVEDQPIGGDGVE
ncbi:MAG: hypothetical protein QM757_45395 [Paludibaculum sp.]